MHFIKTIGKILFVAFAIVGIIFTGVFVAMRLGLTNVRGTIAERNDSFFKDLSKIKEIDSANMEADVSCRVHALAVYAPDTARKIEIAYDRTSDITLIENMFMNALIRFSNTSLPTDFQNCGSVVVQNETPIAQSAYAWADSAEWDVLKSVFIRDQDVIKKASKDAGISPRILLGGVIGEQFRFFTARRESFKSYFEPLKILASLSSFSYGIAGLKPETVARVDQNLKDKTSVFYLGGEMENVITYPQGVDVEKVRFERITDTKNTYYSYLYVGLFMRQVTAQWRASGFEIANQPGILATLYNLGFNRSVPKAAAAPGGAPVTINGQTYSFGQLGEQFYYSGELIQEFGY